MFKFKKIIPIRTLDRFAGVKFISKTSGTRTVYIFDYLGEDKYKIFSYPDAKPITICNYQRILNNIDLNHWKIVP